MSELATRLGFRCADGLAERVIYREFFPRGLSALDNLDEAIDGIARINGDYDRHARRGSELARAHFDARVVLPALLETATR